MPKYLIERDVPGAGRLSRHELMQLSQRACDVAREMGPEIQWVQSFVTGDRFTCVYVAPNADMVREHARRGGFPITSIEEIMTIVDPSTVAEPATIKT